MLKPLSVWHCDVCGDQIASVSDGYVIWKTDDDLRAHSFKVIHKARCDKNDHFASAALEDFVGDDGVAYLMSFLSIGPLKKRKDAPDYCGVASMDEFVDLFRRVQTPYYEEARANFRDPDVREEFSDANEYYPYLPNVLKRIAAEYPR